MKRLFLASVCLIGVCVGCRSAPGTKDDPERVEQRASSPDPVTGTSTRGGDVSPGAFEVAAQWTEDRSPTNDAVESVVETWTDPWVERMHSDGDDYRVLLLGGEEPAEGVLLTIRNSDEQWTVVAAEVVPADYLWPTK